MSVTNQNLSQDFINFCLSKQVLKFGEFRTKAGRITPYFFNAGLFSDGDSLLKLGEFYANSIEKSGIEFDMLFGPAYKGIPLATSIAIAFAKRGRNLPVAYNRKEKKDHGEGGTTVGADLNGRVLIIDDVISAGTSVRESVTLINAHNAIPCGVSIALDRQEKGFSELSAVEEVKLDHKIPICVIANLSDLLNYIESRIHTQPEMAHTLLNIKQYRDKYGR